MTETYLGLDFGGTKLMVGEVDSEEHILCSKQYPTGYCTQQKAVEIMFSAVDDYMANVAQSKDAIKAIGIGLVGRIDSKNGIWLQIDSERNETIHLASLFKERYGLPCFVDNDVKSATTAEMVWGMGKQTKNFVYINVGTGIAAGAVVGGQIIRGANFDACEVGFTVSNISLTSGIGHETVENIAAGIGFDRCARLLRSQYPETVLLFPEEGRVSVKDIYQGYNNGDALCIRLVTNAAESIATLINNMIWTFNPEAVVLGGGVVSDGMMLGLVKQLLNPKVFRFLPYDITLTQLDPRFVGLLGAAAVAACN